MRQLLVSFMLIAVFQLSAQSLDGYYERTDANGQIIERLIITQDYFEQYISDGEILKVGSGKFSLSADSIIFTYQKKKPFNVYRLNYTFDNQKNNKFTLTCKLDTTDYSESIDVYRVIMFDKASNEVDVTNGFTSTIADTIDVTKMALVVNQYYKIFELSSGHNKHDLVIELDNTKTNTLNYNQKAYRITDSSPESFSLETTLKEQHIFFKNSKNEKEFNEYINMKNQIETEL